jgi:hypothetical protein
VALVVRTVRVPGTALEVAVQVVPVVMAAPAVVAVAALGLVAMAVPAVQVPICRLLLASAVAEVVAEVDIPVLDSAVQRERMVAVAVALNTEAPHKTTAPKAFASFDIVLSPNFLIFSQIDTDIGS